MKFARRMLQVVLSVYRCIRQTASAGATGNESPNPPAAAPSAESAGSPPPPSKPRAVTSKSIILFSDGTGNSSAKLFKTNVWRMYEAVDLGPPEAGKRKQIAFYDNGVGTSGFKPFAILGGVFGIGLRRNVLDIYRYACRNYRPAATQLRGQADVEGGDEIYGFGFSRAPSPCGSQSP